MMLKRNQSSQKPKQSLRVYNTYTERGKHNSGRRVVGGRVESPLRKHWVLIVMGSQFAAPLNFVFLFCASIALITCHNSFWFIRSRYNCALGWRATMARAATIFQHQIWTKRLYCVHMWNCFCDAKCQPDKWIDRGSSIYYNCAVVYSCTVHEESGIMSYTTEPRNFGKYCMGLYLLGSVKDRK